MSQWGGCLRRLRDCLRRLLLEEEDEEAVGLMENDKVGGQSRGGGETRGMSLESLGT